MSHKDPLIRIGVDITHEGVDKEITGIFDGWIELSWFEGGVKMVTHTSEYKVARSIYRSKI